MTDTDMQLEEALDEFLDACSLQDVVPALKAAERIRELFKECIPIADRRVPIRTCVSCHETVYRSGRYTFCACSYKVSDD